MDRYYHEVAGAVLIDPSLAGQSSYVRVVGGSSLEQTYWDRGQAQIYGCAALAREGKLSVAAPQGCFGDSEFKSVSAPDYIKSDLLRPFKYESMASELESFHSFEIGQDDDSLEEAAAQRSFGAKPLIVLSAGDDAPDPDTDKAALSVSTQTQRLGHERLAARSSEGQSLVVPNAGHSIQLDAPAAVIAAVQKVLLEVRTAPHWP